jgi:ADP-ribose pyrophosphatase
VGWWKKNLFEVAERAPGVRVLIEKGGKILLSREYRFEIDWFDYRMPGWKTFDTIREYVAFLESGRDMMDEVLQAGKREIKEETWIVVKNLDFLVKDTLWTTVRRDLYYLKAIDFDDSAIEQELGDWEDISTMRYTYEEVLELMKTNHMKESRTKAFLYDYILNQYDLQNK